VMGGTYAEGFSQTDGWKLGVLFLLFVVISYAFIEFNAKLENYLKEKKLRALRHVLHKLQHEIMLLGFISLSLIALQEPLLKICVSGESSSAEQYTHDCGEGKKPFWSATTIHQTHIFIFILAVTHVAYISLSMFVCILKLNSWKKWEAGDHDIVPLNPHINPRLVIDANLFVLIWRAFWAQFRFSVNREVYLSLRRLFVERLGTPDDFHFHDFLVEAMEEDFASIIDTKVFMWVLAALWVTVPRYVFLPGGIAALAIMLFVGTMLEAVNIRLAQAAYERFVGEAAQTSKTMRENGEDDGDAEYTDDNNYSPAPLKNKKNGMDTEENGTQLSRGMQTITEEEEKTAKSQSKNTFSSFIRDRAGDFFKGVTGKGSMHQHKELTSEERSKRRRALRAEIDSKNYFWRGRPQILLTIFQYVLFENAMSLAMLVFSTWQDPDWLSQNANVQANASILLFIVDIIVLLHSAYFILPVYAISSVVGTHCSMSLVEYAKKMGISNERAVEAYRRRSDYKRDDTDSYMYDSSGTQTPDFDDVLKAASSMSPPQTHVKTKSQKAPEILSHFVGVPTDKSMARRNEVPVAPFDHSLDNERSMTALLGAILTKQMREIRAKEAARAAQKAKPRPHSNSPLAALKRTMSGRTLNLGLEEMTDSQQLPSSSRFRGEPLASPTWSVSERAKQKEKEQQEEVQSSESKETPSQGRMVSSMRAVPSLKDVFRFTEQQPSRTRTSFSEETTDEQHPQEEVATELEEVVVEQKRNRKSSLDVMRKTSIDEERETTKDLDDDKSEEEVSKRSIKDIFPM
jgi:hypothetical protein